MKKYYRGLINFLDHYKYLIVIVIGIVVVGFVDENSFMRRIQYELQISDLKAEIKKYNDRNEADMRQLRELKRNPKAIQKIARERYFMKADDEDIFVLSDDITPATPQSHEPSE
ncbi:MAG: septum formation initiator family protein [Prevotella sp.]|nr:septum formation initiator family protein [Prevotella sp.]